MHARTRYCLIRTSAWLLMATLLSACGPDAPKQLHESRQLLGTRFELNLTGSNNNQLEKAAEAAYREMTRVAQLLNPNNPDSPVHAINQAAGQKPVAIPEYLLDLLVRAEALSKRTEGAFDITLGAQQGWSFDRRNYRKPEDAVIAAQRKLVNYRDLRLDPRAGTAALARPGMRIDLGALLRVEIMHAGLRVLRAEGINMALINADGDVGAFGGAPGNPWQVGVRDPRTPHELLGVITLEQGFVTSAGDSFRFFMKDGRRYHPVLDPRSGYPTDAIRGVTLVSDNPATLNGLPQAIMALGMPAGRALIEGTPGLEGLIVDRDGNLWVSAGLKPRFTLGRPLPGSR